MRIRHKHRLRHRPWLRLRVRAGVRVRVRVGVWVRVRVRFRTWTVEDPTIAADKMSSSAMTVRIAAFIAPINVVSKIGVKARFGLVSE